MRSKDCCGIGKKHDASHGAPQPVTLRRGAEKRLKDLPLQGALPKTEEDTLKLLHELQVHQIELEMQNEELHRSQDELRSSRDRYSLLYDFAPIGYFTLSRNGTILSANLAGASLLNRERYRLMGQSFGRFFEGQHYTLFKELLFEVFSNHDEPQTLELLMSKELRQPLFVQIEATTVVPGDECLLAVVNITPRKRAEDELLRAKEELEQRVLDRTVELARSVDQQKKEMTGRLQAVEELRAKELLLVHQSRMAAMGEMLANISHQWRQSLNVMGLLIQQLGLFSESDCLDKQMVDTNVERAMGILNHLSQTIDDFRTLSEPDREKIPFWINEVIEKTLQLVGDFFRDQGISIHCDFVQDSRVAGFPNEFSQALLNLLLNARDALVESKTGDKWIRVSSRPENGRAVITVTDNGGGVDKNIIDKIFDPYFTTKELGKGSGIGLFMSKNIIERSMGGHLTVRNVEGCAEFRIEV
ncbi:PAS domain-containing sensor histidine kinase [Geobacter hydrogenophilus]|uniref:histidine kinase n=1 Tax=Geobacter hydrogenophilus TaxID=40983 RepID=A0A9W6G487_9BACT|nr:ATP-binding protein [Geobacter hydrogenophilus]MBT0892707.1 PAS domain-containing sensor histidine kinase [Geobacter hydrogenophilus]GLI40105.1 hypothetical protein GHYDROH2_36060 [Geobacter hydrogenophilus]